MNRVWWIAPSLVTLLALSGCAVAAPPNGFDPGSGAPAPGASAPAAGSPTDPPVTPPPPDGSGRVGKDQLPTTQPALGLRDGYSSLFDLRRSSCVQASDATPPSVGQPEQQTTITQVQTDTDLANQLGIDATLSVKAPTASGSGAFSMLQSFKSSTSNVSYLIEAVQSYVVAEAGGIALTPDALASLGRDPDDFALRCGDRFVGSVRYSAKILALVTFATTDEEHALSIASSVGAGTGIGVAQVDASIKGNLSNVSQRTDVKTSVTVVTQGFTVASSDALLGLSGTSPTSSNASTISVRPWRLRSPPTEPRTPRTTSETTRGTPSRRS